MKDRELGGRVLLNSNADRIKSSNSNLPSLEVIRQQPERIEMAFEQLGDENFWSYLMPTNFQRLELVASGHSYYAALIGQYLLEQLAGVKTEVRYGSEYTNATSLRLAQGLTLTLLVNLSDMEVGRITEIKASQPQETPVGVTIPIEEESFLVQIMLYYSLTLHLLAGQPTLSGVESRSLWQELQQVPELMQEAMDSQLEATTRLAKMLQGQSVGVILGRGLNYPLALEGARLVQQTGFHALGYAGGEFHHGPKAVISEGLPMIAIAPTQSKVYRQILKNALDMQSLGATIYGITPVGQKEHFEQIIPIPDVSEGKAVFLNLLALQLLANRMGEIGITMNH